ncbi:MAG TPA: hypothetical protein VF147_17920 [Vicinamibacterales bacterium]
MVLQLAGPILVAGLAVLQAQTAVPPRDRPTGPAPSVQVPGLFANSATNPYGNVFVVRALQPGVRDEGPSMATRDTKAQLRCGIMVVPADPSIDPKIAFKATGNPDPKMVIPLPPCPERKR